MHFNLCRTAAWEKGDLYLCVYVCVCWSVTVEAVRERERASKPRVSVR